MKTKFSRDLTVRYLSVFEDMGLIFASCLNANSDQLVKIGIP